MTRRRAPDGETMRFFREEVLPYDGTDCLLWPYGRSSTGYGKIVHDGRQKSVHRLVCEEENGPPPTPEHEAAHSCGKGHEGCCAKRHLSWKTHGGNLDDMRAHGTAPYGERHGAAKLTEQQVREILSMKGSFTQKTIAQQFGVCRQTVGLIHGRQIWADCEAA